MARPRASTCVLLASGAAVWLAGLGFAAMPARAQPGKPAPAAPGAAAPKSTVAKPLWRDLTIHQQRALEPLASTWDGLTEPHKRKWLAISRDYAKLSTGEQEVLQQRMTEWAGLSNQQRAQARYNFADVKQVPANERKAKWEAYQALSEAERNKLAASATATAPTPGAASTIRPVPAQKLAPVPPSALEGPHMPRIQLAPPAPAPTAAAARAPTAPPVTSAPVTSSAPVSAEAQVPPPAASGTTAADAPAPAGVAAPAAPPVRTSDQQPSSAP